MPEDRKEINIVSLVNSVPQIDTVRIGFLGDISLNGRYRRKDYSFLDMVFCELRQFISDKKVDFLIGNLESPLQGDGSENVLKRPRIKASKESFHALRTLKPDILVLGNNHVFDCLDRGYDNTTNWLEANGIRHVGTFRKGDKTAGPFRFQVKGQWFSLLSYVAEDTNPSLPDGADIQVNFMDPERMKKEIRSEARNAFVIVSLHWGIEFSHYPSPEQRILAHGLIDAGAGIIMGHHTHTLQGIEKYKGGYIFYSLGNCAFDDVTDDESSVLWNRDQRHGGLGIADIIDRSRVSAELHVTVNKDLIVGIEKDEKWRKTVLKRSRVLREKEKEYQRFWLLYQIADSMLLPPLRYFFGERKNFVAQLLSIRIYHLRKVVGYFKTYRANTENKMAGH